MLAYQVPVTMTTGGGATLDVMVTNTAQNPGTARILLVPPEPAGRP